MREIRIPETRWTYVIRIRWDTGFFGINIGWPFEPNSFCAGYYRGWYRRRMPFK